MRCGGGGGGEFATTRDVQRTETVTETDERAKDDVIGAMREVVRYSRATSTAGAGHEVTVWVVLATASTV